MRLGTAANTVRRKVPFAPKPPNSSSQRRVMKELPESLFQAPDDREETWPDDKDVRRAVEWFKGFLKPGEWKKRRDAAANRLYSASLGRIDQSDGGRYFEEAVNRRSKICTPDNTKEAINCPQLRCHKVDRSLRCKLVSIGPVLCTYSCTMPSPTPFFDPRLIQAYSRYDRH